MRKYQAWIDDEHFILVEGPGVAERVNNTRIGSIELNSREFIVKVDHVINNDHVVFHSENQLPLGEEINLHFQDIQTPVYARNIVRTNWFETNYDASHLNYGAIYHKKGTMFRVWSPIATRMSVNVNNVSYKMKRLDKGVWEYFVKGECHGAVYYYDAMVNGERVQVVDPYTKAVTTNSTAGVVVDLSRTDPSNFRETEKPILNDLQDSSIYELHIRDATIQAESGVVDRGKYLGLTEKGTKTRKGFSSALQYIKELGITHVQLLPVNDFARVNDLSPDDQYNWGYDPLFYQVPEGSYSVTPTDPFSRLIEFKQLVDTFHKENLSVILDVVYNHVFIIEESSFHRIVPGYYFRYHGDGRLSDGTGVGNDIASERIMVRKFILDTIDFWLTEYRVDGFRFDLMGAIDVQTMREIKQRCDLEENPIMLLGEGWELPTALSPEQKATSSQAHQLPGIRFFNDLFRDTIKGNLFDFHDYGFINGKGRYIERLPQLVKGSCMDGEVVPPFVNDVTQTVNYVEVHDNHTLWDRLAQSNNEEDVEDRHEMQKLATGLTIVSQGIPFIHAGQEWFRTKKGDGNSYISGDEVNQLDWMEREKHDEHIQFVRKLLAIRNEYPAFRLKSKIEINQRIHILATPAPVFGYTIFGIKRDFCIYVNPSKKRFQLQLPSLGKWAVLVSNQIKDLELPTYIEGEHTEIEPYGFLLVKKSRL